MFCPRFSFYRLCFIVPRKDPRGQSIAAIHRELFLFSYIFWSACFMMTDSEFSMFSRTIPPTVPLILLYAVMMPSAPLSSIHLRNGSRYSSYLFRGSIEEFFQPRPTSVLFP